MLKGTWPHDAKTFHNGNPEGRPMVSLLFSGGVFRGVFQVGVLNALSELNVRPDIVAGASIGSITAAMAAEVLAVQHEDTVSSCRQIARITAIYLAVDWIILTDRFADFIREWSIRAADTRFSLRQVDTLFRKYDRTDSDTFGRSARQVIAGLERLFYINPFQLNLLARALRARQSGRAGRLLRKLGQQWLDRMQVGEEALGAGALQQLIEHFVIQRLKGAPEEGIRREFPAGVFDDFLANGVLMLATCTDLTEGRLVTLGDPFATESVPERVDLLEALLASSAFPGVFRPRWSPELFPDSYSTSQFIDGGVTDNLPIDAVVQSLWKTSSSCVESRLIRRRPSLRPWYTQDDARFRVPHLAIVTSLEANVYRITEESSARAMEDYWPALTARAKKLGYISKLTIYERAAKQINAWMDATEHQGSVERPETDCPGEISSVELDIVAIKPNWLCGTFAFHPMLGYRRKKQAESIAHGCASTLLQLGQCPRKYLQAWGVEIDRLPAAATFEQAVVSADRWRAYSGKGRCWLSPGKRCPFSAAALHALNASTEECSERLENKTIAELAVIHEVCGRLKTYRLQ
ncbi:MAG: patatin-like phospholipase family protein [Chromatiales bacterium]|jgi:predicted acylesterase/phospholipase RssA